MAVNRTRRRLGCAAVATALALGLSACQPSSGGSEPAVSQGSGGSGAATGGTSAGVAFVDHGVFVAKGQPLTVTCNGAPPTDRDVRQFKDVVDVAPGTRLRVDDGASYTLCPGTAYKPVAPMVSVDGLDFYRYRVWVQNASRHVIYGPVVGTTVYPAGRPKETLPNAFIDDGDGYPWPYGAVYPGESGTWEIVLGLPSDGKVYLGDSEVGYQLAWRLRDGVTAGRPAPVTLPTPTTLPTARRLPTAPAGLTVSSDGAVVGKSAQLPHECNGVPPTRTVTVTSLLKETPTTLRPGESLELAGFYTATLCPGETFQPTGSVIPSGAGSYRVYTAYVTVPMTGIPVDVGSFFANVMDPAVKPVPGSGRVWDPTEVPYLPRKTIGPGETAKFLVAVAIPAAGGPYAIAANEGLYSVYALD